MKTCPLCGAKITLFSKMTIPTTDICICRECGVEIENIKTFYRRERYCLTRNEEKMRDTLKEYRDKVNSFKVNRIRGSSSKEQINAENHIIIFFSNLEKNLRDDLESMTGEKERQIQEEKLRHENLIAQRVLEHEDSYNTQLREFGGNLQLDKKVTIERDQYYIFLYQDALNFFICPPHKWEAKGYIEWKKRSIPLSDIQCFYTKGDLQFETKISGGGGSNIDLGGAIVGAAIAGGAGAILGGRTKIEEIRTESVKHDDRCTVLQLKNEILLLAYQDYDILMLLIPEKEISFVQQQKAMQASKTNAMPSVEERLAKLKDLLDKGLIAEDEYTQKRKEILDSI